MINSKMKNDFCLAKIVFFFFENLNIELTCQQILSITIKFTLQIS